MRTVNLIGFLSTSPGYGEPLLLANGDSVYFPLSFRINKISNVRSRLNYEKNPGDASYTFDADP